MSDIISEVDVIEGVNFVNLIILSRTDAGVANLVQSPNEIPSLRS